MAAAQSAPGASHGASHDPVMTRTLRPHTSDVNLKLFDSERLALVQGSRGHAVPASGAPGGRSSRCDVHERCMYRAARSQHAWSARRLPCTGARPACPRGPRAARHGQAGAPLATRNRTHACARAQQQLQPQSADVRACMNHHRSYCLRGFQLHPLSARVPRRNTPRALSRARDLRPRSTSHAPHPPLR